jgi:probable rRNA maturation factor
MIVFDPSQAFSSTANSSRRTALPGKRALERFLTEACAAIRLRGEVSVLLTNDDAIRDLNRRFRRKNKATDVLSFPAADPETGISGDLAISLETAARQAEAFGHTLREEVKILLLHGILHLAGYDHEIDDGRMGRREVVLRRRFALPLGLIQRASAEKAKPISPRAKRTNKAKAVALEPRRGSKR